MTCKECKLDTVLNSVGLCATCAPPVKAMVARAAQIVFESIRLVEQSKHLKTKLFRCDTIIQIAEELLLYEERGIPTIEPHPAALIETYRTKRDQLAGGT